jgi:hypothetical protein
MNISNAMKTQSCVFVVGRVFITITLRDREQ